MITIKSKIKNVSFTQIGTNSWVVIANCVNGDNTNIGNYKTSGEAKALADFINQGIQSEMSFDHLNHLHEAMQTIKKK